MYECNEVIDCKDCSGCESQLELPTEDYIEQVTILAHEEKDKYFEERKEGNY
jgi:hypothetical protein